jgi:hypothetical protein
MQTKEKRCMEREVISAGAHSAPRKFHVNLIIQTGSFSDDCAGICDGFYENIYSRNSQ